MRGYWDERARQNAAWYVDTSLSFDHPDMEKFFANGKVIVEEALDKPPAIAPAQHEHALEIGCGLGRICLALADRFDRVTGVDISSEMIDRAREAVTDERVTFMVGEGDNLAGVPGASVDLVLSFTVFQHIPKISVIESYIRDVGRVLRPGGVFVFQWSNEGGSRAWSIRRALLATLQRTGVRKERHERNAAEFLGSRVPLRTIEAAARDGGMRIEATKGTGTLFAFAWAVKG
jgi:SAM-dependent methyltransferase